MPAWSPPGRQHPRFPQPGHRIAKWHFRSVKPPLRQPRCFGRQGKITASATPRSSSAAGGPARARGPAPSARWPQRGVLGIVGLACDPAPRRRSPRPSALHVGAASLARGSSGSAGRRFRSQPVQGLEAAEKALTAPEGEAFLPGRVVLVVADVVCVAVHQQPPDRRAAGGQQGGADAAGAVSPRGHGRSSPAPGVPILNLPFCRQHKTNTTPGSGKDQHVDNTDKTVLPGTRRHAC